MKLEAGKISVKNEVIHHKDSGVILSSNIFSKEFFLRIPEDIRKLVRTRLFLHEFFGSKKNKYIYHAWIFDGMSKVAT